MSPEGDEIRYPVGTYKKDIELHEGWELKLDYEVDDVRYACYNAKHTLQRIYERVSEHFGEPPVTKIYLTSDDKSNFRFDLAKTKPYKGNRKAPKPIHYEAVRDYLVDKHGATVVSGIEADDALGTAMWSNRNHLVVLASIDKDMRMIPGNHYNFVTDKFDRISKLQAAYNFYKQLLTGDTVDNIPGLPGWGPVKAQKLLHSQYSLDTWTYTKRMEEAVIQAYHDYLHADWKHDTEAGCGHMEYLMEQANLLWIRREKDQKWYPGLLYEEKEIN